MSAPTFQIPQDVIQPIIQANITAAIAQALGGSANVLEKAISTILSTQVDGEGKPSSYSHHSHRSWLDWAVGDAIPTTRYVMPHHRKNCTAAASKRYAHVVEGKLVTTGQIAKRIGIHEETALRRAKRGPFPLTWEGLAIHGRNMQ